MQVKPRQFNAANTSTKRVASLRDCDVPFQFLDHKSPYFKGFPPKPSPKTDTGISRPDSGQREGESSG